MTTILYVVLLVLLSGVAMELLFNHMQEYDNEDCV